jgi:phage shock protein A
VTIDQRLELVQSTESLHATTALHSEQIARNSEQIDLLTAAVGRLERKFEQMASTLGEVSILALNHERRLGKLDGGGEAIS